MTSVSHSPGRQIAIKELSNIFLIAACDWPDLHAVGAEDLVGSSAGGSAVTTQRTRYANLLKNEPLISEAGVNRWQRDQWNGAGLDLGRLARILSHGNDGKLYVLTSLLRMQCLHEAEAAVNVYNRNLGDYSARSRLGIDELRSDPELFRSAIKVELQESQFENQSPHLLDLQQALDDYAFCTSFTRVLRVVSGRLRQLSLGHELIPSMRSHTDRYLSQLGDDFPRFEKLLLRKLNAQPQPFSDLALEEFYTDVAPAPSFSRQYSFADTVKPHRDAIVESLGSLCSSFATLQTRGFK